MKDFDVEYEVKQIKERLDELERNETGAEMELNEFHDFKEAVLEEFDKLVDLLIGFRDNVRDS